MHITKLANMFARKLAAVELCPDCGGLGFESEDKYSDARGHYTKEIKCTTCDGEGTVGEEEEEELSPDTIANIKQHETVRADEFNKLKEAGRCLACKGTGKFLGWKDTDKICPLCGGSGKETTPKGQPFPKIKNPYGTPPGSGIKLLYL
jgi:DnaJ-class molecular chaperone